MKLKMTNENDLIPRGDAMKALDWGDIYGRNAQDAIAALPAAPTGVGDMIDIEQAFLTDVVAALKADATDLGKEARILNAFREAVAALPAAPMGAKGDVEAALKLIGNARLTLDTGFSEMSENMVYECDVVSSILGDLDSGLHHLREALSPQPAAMGVKMKPLRRFNFKAVPSLLGDETTWAMVESDDGEFVRFADIEADITPQPAPTLETYYAAQIEWSRQTFGPALRTKGVIDHITKELREIAADPHDLSEWVDVVILAMDGFWRHGGKASDLMPALLAKQAKNMARTWPDWRTRSEDQAIEHDRSGEVAPAPTLRDALELPEVRAMVKTVSDAATFIVEQVETTRAYAKGSDMGASNVTLIEINTSHFLDIARILHNALAALKGGA